MNNICLTIAYAGTHYAGWQRQINGISVQQKVEEALAAVYGQPVPISGASRTDAGVHALGQRGVFAPPHHQLPVDKLPHILKHKLPDDIVISAAQYVPKDFNPRHARQKTYLYYMDNGPFPNPLCRHMAWHVHYPLDFEAMTQAAWHMCGTHDFAGFCATGGQAKTTVRTVFDVTVSTGEGAQQELVCIAVTGNAFLYNMVRIMAGTLYYVGLGKINAQDIPAIIAGKDRTKAGVTAPAHGLTLKCIEYELPLG